MSFGGHSLVEHVEGGRDSYDWVPESSRRARGFVILAALHALGRAGLPDLIERCCRLTRRMAELLGAAPGVEILNDVVLNQLLVRFTPSFGSHGAAGSDVADGDAFNRDVIRRVQEDGTCWLGGRSWHGLGTMRISITSWNTTEADIDRSAEAILRCAAAGAAERDPNSRH
jgi:glutamate/tyrosine decarboxylase-like PLP-dependent enzyme